MTTNETKPLPNSRGLLSSQIQQLEEQAVSGKPMAFLLARKGSKRLKNKNKLLFKGKPLFLYSLEAAIKSNIFERVIVSSDDMEILEIAYENKAMTHLRHKELASDKVQMKQVIRWLLSAYPCGNSMCVINPCNPFVTSQDFIDAWKIFVDNKANYVMSVLPAKLPPEYSIALKKGMIEPKSGTERSQKCSKCYYHDGMFIFANPDVFLSEMDYGFYGTNNYPYFTPRFSIDIDTQEDFDLAEKLF